MSSSWRDEYRRLRKAGVPQAEAAARARGSGAPPAAPQAEPPGVSGGEAIGRGAVQGATAGYADESVGAVAVNPYFADPESSQFMPPMPPGKREQIYTQARDAERTKNDAAQAAHPGKYLVGQVGGALAAAPALAMTGGGGVMAAGDAGLIYGGASALGASRADLTRGEFNQAATDTLVGSVAGGAAGVAGNAAGKAIGATARSASAALGKNKMVGSLTKYLDNITQRNGDPELQKKVAGQLMNEAITAAGDTPLASANYMKLGYEIYHGAKNPLAGGMTAWEKEIADGAQALADKPGGPSATLQELANGMKKWGARVADSHNDPGAQRTAKMALDALKADLEAAAGNKSIGAAGEILGRAEYAKAARNAELSDIITKAEDPKSIDQFISPSKFATANSGMRRVEVERLLKADPEALEAWRMGVDAAKLLAQRGDSWLPKLFTDLSPEAKASMDRLMTYRNISKIFGSTENAREFGRLMTPGAVRDSETAMEIIAKISARIAGDNTSVRPAYASMDRPERVGRMVQ